MPTFSEKWFSGFFPSFCRFWRAELLSKGSPSALRSSLWRPGGPAARNSRPRKLGFVIFNITQRIILSSTKIRKLRQK